MNLLVIAVALFVGLVVCLEVGYRIGAKQVKANPKAHEGFGAIEGAVFGPFGLLLSLSFFGAASRLDSRRQLIVQEANAIASAYMRVDLLPPLCPKCKNRRSCNRQSGHARLTPPRKAPRGAPLLVLAVNQMTEIASAKAIAVQTHLPELVFDFLIATSLLSGLVAGFGMARGRRNWLSALVYASIVTMTLYVMIDMEYPRSGLIRIGAADRAMINLRDSIQ